MAGIRCAYGYDGERDAVSVRHPFFLLNIRWARGACLSLFLMDFCLQKENSTIG